jgi:hypothetical protein
MCMPVDNFEDYEQELEEAAEHSRGPGDPDAHGYPGEIINEQGVTPNVTTDTNQLDLTNVPF